MVRIEGIEKDALQHMYWENGMPQREIATHYGVGHVTILARMKEYDISVRQSRPQALYRINVDFFKAWTPESAWLFGWALGDGTYTNGYNLRFNLARVDKEALFKFRGVLDSEHPVKDYETWNKRTQKHCPMSVVQLNSKELVSDLRELSYTDIPLEYFSHFLRGFFEAEGCIYWQKSNTPKGGSIRCIIANANNNILYFIHSTLKDYLGIVRRGGLSLQKIWRLSFSVNDSISLYHYLYAECGDMFLKRKKDRFEELISKQQVGKREKNRRKQNGSV